MIFDIFQPCLEVTRFLIENSALIGKRYINGLKSCSVCCGDSLCNNVGCFALRSKIIKKSYYKNTHIQSNRFDTMRFIIRKCILLLWLIIKETKFLSFDDIFAYISFIWKGLRLAVSDWQYRLNDILLPF